MKDQILVVGPQLSERLRDLGLRQKSLYYWFYDVIGCPELVSDAELSNRYPSMGGFHIAALTIPELDNLLPKEIEGGESAGMAKWQYSFLTEFRGKVTRFQSSGFTDDSEINAKAGLLMQLLKEGYYAQEKTI